MLVHAAEPAAHVPAELLAALAEREREVQEVTATGRLTEVNTVKMPAGAARTSQFEVLRSGDRLSLKITNNRQMIKTTDGSVQTTPQKESVMAQNDDYHFRLERPASAPSLSIVDYGALDKRFTADLRARLGPIVDCGVFFGPRKMRDFLATPTLKIDGYSENREAEGRTLVTLRFSTPPRSQPPTVKGRPAASLHSGQITFWKEAGYLVMNVEMRFASSNNSFAVEVLRIEYKNLGAKPSVPQKVTKQTIDVPGGDVTKPIPEAGSKMIDQTVYEYDTFRFGPIPDSRFTLSEYGIPEMADGKARAATSRSFILIAAGGVVLAMVVGLGLIRHFRRAKVRAHAA